MTRVADGNVKACYQAHDALNPPLPSTIKERSTRSSTKSSKVNDDDFAGPKASTGREP
uniref:hypothetical protein n=1 Tax=Tessaracoccus bendigoensis TaxID=72764 RepID=UPI001588291D|nr:hypothetical protein [Tessaracoccus bendigoensis]